MPQSNVTTWLSFVLQQMAAESYLDDININNPDQVIDALIRGNNRRPFPATSFTRFTDLDPQTVPNANEIAGSAQAFVSRYRIVDQHADDASGFSATLMFDTQTQTYTLSFRSTEYKNQIEGGDYERDGANFPSFTGADGEILTSGFAFGQLAAMEQYWSDLTQGKLSDGTTVSLCYGGEPA